MLKYKYMASPIISFASSGKVQVVHQQLEGLLTFRRPFKLLVRSKHLEKGSTFSPDLDNNLSRTERGPFRHCTSLWQVKHFIPYMDLRFSKLTSIPLVLTVKLKYFPGTMPKPHLKGLRRILCNFIHSSWTSLAWHRRTTPLYPLSYQWKACYISSNRWHMHWWAQTTLLHHDIYCCPRRRLYVANPSQPSESDYI